MIGTDRQASSCYVLIAVARARAAGHVLDGEAVLIESALPYHSGQARAEVVERLTRTAATEMASAGEAREEMTQALRSAVTAAVGVADGRHQSTPGSREWAGTRM